MVDNDVLGDYADQIKLPLIAPGPDAQAATDLQAVIRRSLRSCDGFRLRAADAQRQLFHFRCAMAGPTRLTPPARPYLSPEADMPADGCSALTELQASQQLASSSNLLVLQHSCRLQKARHLVRQFPEN